MEGQQKSRKEGYMIGTDIMRRDEDYVPFVRKRMMRIGVDGRRRKEDRSGGGWTLLIKFVDLREKGLSGRRRKTGLCGGKLSHTSTPDRSCK